MKCVSCGTDNPESAKFCCNCGHLLETAPVNIAEGAAPAGLVADKSSSVKVESKKFKRIPLVFLTLIILLTGIYAVNVMMKASQYKAALSKLEEGNYENAAAAFSKLGDYKESEIYLMECTYQSAIQLLGSGDYARAIEDLTSLGEYKDAFAYLEKAKIGRKYEWFNTEPVENEWLADIMMTAPEDVETALECSVYGSWYAAESGEAITTEKFEIAGQAYCIRSATDLDGYLTFECCTPDDAEHQFIISIEPVYFEYIGEVVERLDIYDTASDTGASYFSVTPEEYESLSAQNEEAEANQPQYSDQQVIEKTFSAFKSKIKGNYSGAGTLYHSASYSDANVEYDWTSRMYYCTMTAQYSTNVFDFWGTSTQTYFIAAELMDTGFELKLISFSIT